MNLLRVQNGKYVFHLEHGERELLKFLLKLYPVIPSAHQAASKSGLNDNQESQRLLDEALAEQRKENKGLVESFLNDGKRLRQLKTSSRLIVSAGDIEWLLQILNDVRVGNWLMLGSPDAELWDLELNDKTAPHIRAMDYSGFFQSNLLEALSKKM